MQGWGKNELYVNQQFKPEAIVLGSMPVVPRKVAQGLSSTGKHM